MFLLSLLACGADLPSGWEDAQPIEHFSQEACTGEDAYSGEPAVVTASLDGSGTSVVYDHAIFRCEQSVEGWYKPGEGDSIDVLVQPIDMNPKMIAACDCVYRISMDVPEASSVSVYRRWDNLNDPNDPVLEGSVTPR